VAVPLPSIDSVHEALGRVQDPEIHRPLPELGMVKSVHADPGGAVTIAIWLTVSGCPMRATIESRVRDEVSRVADVTSVVVELDVMSDEQRKELRTLLQGHDEREIPFTKPGSLTRIYAIASGKGGVGKSSLTVNLAVSMAASGLSVGLVDADIYGHSIPRMIGATGAPTMVEGMIMAPQAHGVRVISMLPFKPGGVNQPVAFRGPMLHRALNQFLADVWWGDLDILLLDLPPGTGDVAISLAQLLPSAELIVVTTPQRAAAEVAIRAGMLANETGQRVAGVIENMSGFGCPQCGEPIELFGSGGGQVVADTLTAELGTDVRVLGRIPFDPALRQSGDSGEPLVLSDPGSSASIELAKIATDLGSRARGLVGVSLGVTPASRS